MSPKSIPLVRTLWARYLFFRRTVAWLVKLCSTPRKDWICFRCNICGKSTSFAGQAMFRESWSCRFCASTVRWRSVIHALSVELFGESLALPDFPVRPDLVGIGLSDWTGYAAGLEAKLSYTNTFYHKEPFLDITSISDDDLPQYDFLISSDVFEHICPPVSRAFVNARRLLKPGGVMILTVPYVDGGTREHFPEVCNFTLQKSDGHWLLLGKTSDQETRVYRDLTFHGGPGTVVECRLFGKQSLLEQSHQAGFSTVRIHAEAAEKFGVLWVPYYAEKAPYTPPIFGLDTPPWALVNGHSGEQSEASVVE